MSLRDELVDDLTRLQAERVADPADNAELARLARREIGDLIRKLASGGRYRVRRDELPTRHAVRKLGRSGDLLVLDAGEDEQGASCFTASG